MFKRSTISLAVAAAFVAPSLASAGFWEDFTDSIEVNGYVKNETSVFIQDGSVTGEQRNMLDDRQHSAGDVLKFENSARFFVNGLIGENSSWHADINMICDSKGVNTDYTCHKSYTQHDWLKELYVDTQLGDWSFRLGKQQVVWGTADGIKLLDIINPTDFRELNQNSFEDARIPVWMINAETDIGDAGNLQIIVSQFRPNFIPGLNSNGDRGHPFMLKGVETITGEVNGFLNIAPALTSVATSFNVGAALGLINGVASPLGLTPITGLSVDGWSSTLKRVAFDPATGAQFIQLQNPDGSFSPLPPGFVEAPGSVAPGYIYLNNLAQNGLYPGDPNGNDNETNLLDVNGPAFFQVNWDVSRPTSAFEYMPNTTFSTFNTFDGADSQYVADKSAIDEANGGLRFRGSTGIGLNYSVNYFYHYGANPGINMSWNDAVTGEQLTVQRAEAGDFINNGTGAPGPDGMPDMPNILTDVAANDVPNTFGAGAQTGDFSDMITMLVHNNAGEYYGTYPQLDPSTGMFTAVSTNGMTLRLNEDYYRVHSLGTSFDYGVDVGSLPMVLRAEFLYDKDEQQPVVDKRLLGIGDLTNALRMEDQDRFSYVLGADMTVLTNMLISGQFIQFNNLDYVDDSRTCYSQVGTPYDCSRYTADFATVSLSNNMNKGYEHKEFYSLFFSKPFGEGQLGRWNNITIFEEGGGWWNRLDAEYSLTDAVIVSGELNLYWGDEDTTFGQFENSSNAQLGVKFLWGD